MKGADNFFEEVEEWVESIKGTNFEGKYEEGAEGEESKKDEKEEDEVWMIGLGNDSNLVEVTRTEYLAKNLSK